MWYEESSSKVKKVYKPKFSLCCSQGKIQVPLMKEPLELLKHLLLDQHSSNSKSFKDNIRVYNTMFAFTSMGGKVDNSINNGNDPYVFRMYGQNYHRIGSLLPIDGNPPRFGQLYIYDTENEVNNRLSIFR